MDDFFNSAGGSMAVGALSSLSNSLVNFGLNSYMQDKQFALNNAMYDKMYRDNLKMWNMTNEYNSPIAERARREAAGYNALDDYGTNPAQPLNAPSMSGVSPMPVSFGNPYSAALDSALKQAQIDLTKAQESKVNSETGINDVNRRYLEETLQTRQRALELSNSISQEQASYIQSKRDEVKASIDKLFAETQNEFERGLLIQAQTALNSAQANEIMVMLPFKQDLAKADTEAKRAAASASFWSAMYQKGLISSGYIDKMCTEADARISASSSAAEASKARAAIDEWKNSVHTGHVFDWILENPDAFSFEKGLAGFFNGAFNVANMITTSVGNVFPKL